MTRPRIAVLPTAKLQADLFPADVFEELRLVGDLVRNETDKALEPDEIAKMLAGCDAAITSWGVKKLDARALRGAKSLRAVAHAAGTVKGVTSDDLWSLGVKVTSGAMVIAIDVAEAALGMLIVGMKNAFRISRALAKGGWTGDHGEGTARCLGRKKIGIISASHVGRQMMRLLRSFDAQVLLYDPFVKAERAREFGARKVELDELLRESHAISVHAPSIPATDKMLNAAAFALMRDDCVIVNTARGSIIDEPALIKELKKGRFFACIDVTEPEPPADDSPLRTLPNVVLTPHIAGGNDNRWRLGLHAAQELGRFFRGEKMLGEVTREMLATMA